MKEVNDMAADNYQRVILNGGLGCCRRIMVRQLRET